MNRKDDVFSSIWFYSFVDQMPSVHTGSFAHEMIDAEAFASNCTMCEIFQAGDCYSFYVTLYMKVGRGRYADGELGDVVVK